jgi:hypothetical protein
VSAVAVQLGAVAERLFEDVMAPLVLGGALRPPHAMGARVALALGAAERLPADIDLASRVQVARVRRARRLAPVDRFGPPSAAEWALAAAVSDVLQSTNPTFDAALRRRAATRILSVAVRAIERVPLPVHPKEALSRHTWLARILEVARTDTTVSWWVGSQTYFGVEPPARIRAWPSVRRVNVSARGTPLLELGPLAFERERLVEALALLLEKTPLTDIATCSRLVPLFAWTPGALALVSSHAGRTLALRVLAHLPSQEADAALGRASRPLLKEPATAAAPAGEVRQAPPEVLAIASLLAHRAIALAQSGDLGSPGAWSEDVAVARGLGAAAARGALAAGQGTWSSEQRRALLAALETGAHSPLGVRATSAIGGVLDRLAI